ncbi:MAG: class I tRNA ligase family protein, partial [Nanoarchaeota archaeon]
DIENFRYNLAIIKLRELFEVFMKESESLTKKDAEIFLKLLSIFCPHIAEEIWHSLGNKSFISLQSWPKANEKKIDKNIEKQEQTHDALINDIKNITKLVKEKQKKEINKIYVYVIPNELPIYNEEELKNLLSKEVRVFAVNNKNKYDPENKSSKAKPGKPGIYVE